MSSNLSEELKRLNKGKYVVFKYYQSRDQKLNNKKLEILGLLEPGTFCFVCEKIATCSYKNYKVCSACYKSLSKNKKESQIYEEDRIIRYGGMWLSDTYPGLLSAKEYEQKLDIIPDEKLEFEHNKYNPGIHYRYKYYYISPDPEAMFKLSFLGKKKRIGDINCMFCEQFMEWTFGHNSICFENYHACLDCGRAAEAYFDLKLITYMFLKKIFAEEPNISKHAVLYHHKIKLRNCLRT